MNKNMTKEEFLQELTSKIKDYLPEEYQNAETRVKDVHKLGKDYTGLVISNEGEDVVAPTIDVDLMYEAYQNGAPMDIILERCTNQIGIRPPKFDIELVRNYEKAKEHLFIRVCNADRNREVLSGAPHKCIEDLAITYHLMLANDSEGFGSTLITSQLMENYGVTAEQLHDDAIANSQKLFSPALHDMTDVMLEPFGRKAANLLESDTVIHEVPMLILTNNENIFGAGSIFYPGILERVARIIGGSFYVLPLSVHETIILTEDEDDDVEQLYQMVATVIDEVVEPAERLSDQICHYDCKGRIFETAEHYMNRKRKDAIL